MKKILNITITKKWKLRPQCDITSNLRTTMTRPHIRLPILGIQQRDWESPGNLTLKVSRIWSPNFHRTGGNRDLLGGWAQTKPCVHWDPGERSSNPTRGWARPACGCLRVSCRDVGQQWPAAGTGLLAAVVLEGVVCWPKSSWSRSPLAPR